MSYSINTRTMKNLSLIFICALLFLGCDKEEPITDNDVSTREFLEWHLSEYDITGLTVYNWPNLHEPILDIIECENLSYDIVPEDRGVSIHFLINDTLKCTENLYYTYADVHFQFYWEEIENPIRYLQIGINE